MHGSLYHLAYGFGGLLVGDVGDGSLAGGLEVGGGLVVLVAPGPLSPWPGDSLGSGDGGGGL